MSSKATRGNETPSDRVAAVWRILQGEDVVAVASDLGLPADTVMAWLETFTNAGTKAVEGTPDGLVTTRFVSISDAIADGPHADHFVWWDEIEERDVEAFAVALDTARIEEDIQAYLTAHPLILVQPLGGGHGRWVIPKKQLGAEHVTDFVIGDKDSTGFSWIAVELESPHAHLFTKKGDETKELRHAFRQIDDWRVWLGQNNSYARSPRRDGGLELFDITPKPQAWVIIGRRTTGDSRFDARRRHWRDQEGVEVHTYDWLLDRARGRVADLRRNNN